LSLNVLLTVDTEFWPGSNVWPQSRLARPWLDCELQYDLGIQGRTPHGDFGLPYLLQTLSQYDLRATFFVESLFASAFSPHLLAKTVGSIQAARQEVQLHVHTEWLAEIESAVLPSGYWKNLADLSVDRQTAVIGQALSNLRRSGANNVIALRAGNMGGNHDTPVAAKHAGLELDFSIDPAQGLEARRALHEVMQRAARGVACTSVPLSCVRTMSGRLRHVQLAALSARELQSALRAASHEEWDCFIILLHSFELVSRGRAKGSSPQVNKVNVARWHSLCRFLSDNRDRFTTVPCAALKRQVSSPNFATANPIDTLLRMGEQLYSRLI